MTDAREVIARAVEQEAWNGPYQLPTSPETVTDAVLAALEAEGLAVVEVPSDTNDLTRHKTVIGVFFRPTNPERPECFAVKVDSDMVAFLTLEQVESALQRYHEMAAKESRHDDG